jgi:hypothetical protein
MATNRPAGLPRAPAGVAAVIAAVFGAPLLDGPGLLLPAGAPSPSAALLLRAAGVAVAVGAVGALVVRRGADWRTVPSALGAAAAVGATLALLTLPASPVALDWPPPADPAALPPTEVPPATGGATDPAAAPPVLRLPAGGGLTVQGDVLLLELPDGSTFDLGRTDGGGAGALPPSPVIQLEVTGGGGVTLTDGAGTALGSLPVEGAGGLDLGDVRIEDAAGGGVAQVDGGTLTDAGGGASGRLEVVPEAPDRRGQDVAATVAGVLLAAGAYYLVFLHGRLRPRRVAPTAPVPEAPAPPVRAQDPAAAGAGLAATLEAMLLDPDPATAIVAAYARLLDALDDAGYGRRPQEAPHEHLRRVLQPLGARPGPVHDLADLFVLARFGHAPLTDDHRSAAIDALRSAVDDLRIPVAVPA